MKKLWKIFSDNSLIKYLGIDSKIFYWVNQQYELISKLNPQHNNYFVSVDDYKIIYKVLNNTKSLSIFKNNNSIEPLFEYQFNYLSKITHKQKLNRNELLNILNKLLSLSPYIKKTNEHNIVAYYKIKNQNVFEYIMNGNTNIININNKEFHTTCLDLLLSKKRNTHNNNYYTDKYLAVNLYDISYLLNLENEPIIREHLLKNNLLNFKNIIYYLLDKEDNESIQKLFLSLKNPEEIKIFTKNFLSVITGKHLGVTYNNFSFNEIKNTYNFLFNEPEFLNIFIKEANNPNNFSLNLFKHYHPEEINYHLKQSIFNHYSKDKLSEYFNSIEEPESVHDKYLFYFFNGSTLNHKYKIPTAQLVSLIKSDKISLINNPDFFKKLKLYIEHDYTINKEEAYNFINKYFNYEKDTIVKNLHTIKVNAKSIKIKL